MALLLVIVMSGAAAGQTGSHRAWCARWGGDAPGDVRRRDADQDRRVPGRLARRQAGCFTRCGNGRRPSVTRTGWSRARTSGRWPPTAVRPASQITFGERGESQRSGRPTAGSSVSCPRVAQAEAATILPGRRSRDALRWRRGVDAHQRERRREPATVGRPTAAGSRI